MSIDSVRPNEILDVDGTLARFGGDKQLFSEMAAMLLEDAPNLLAELETAVKAKNAAAVRMHAHALRGVVAGCGGVRAAQAAQSLEDAGHNNNLSGAAALLDALELEIDQLKRALRQYQP